MKVNDTELVQAIRENPEQGFAMLMANYKMSVYWHIRRLVVSHDDAQDAAQETFVRVFCHIDQYDCRSSFVAWMYKIATHEALRLLQRRKNITVFFEDSMTKAEHLKAGDYVDYADLEAIKLQRAILSLPTRQQIAFNLRYYDELEYDEIAEIIDSTGANVKANYHLAKDKIIRFMNSHD